MNIFDQPRYEQTMRLMCLVKISYKLFVHDKDESSTPPTANLQQTNCLKVNYLKLNYN